MHETVDARVVHAQQVFLLGTDAAGSRLRDEIRREGWKRAVLLANSSLRETRAVERFRTEALADMSVLLPDESIEPHALVRRTEALAREVRGSSADVLIALGGGSVSDTAKGVSVLLAEGGRLEDHCIVFTPPSTVVEPELRQAKTPVVSVPTTLSGAEVTPGGGVTTIAGVKRAFRDPQVASRIIAFDPGLLRDVPSSILVSTGMNALAHCAEGLYSRTANAISSALAVRGAALLAAGLRSLAEKNHRDEQTMGRLAAGALLGGLVITNARVGLHHAVCHVLGARLGVPHGVANSIVLPHALRFNESVSTAAQHEFSRALGMPSASAADAVERLRLDIGAPQRLREAGVARENLGEVAVATMLDRALLFNPRPVSDPGQIQEVLEDAW